MSRDSLLVQQLLTKSSGFASKTPNTDGRSLLQLRFHSRGKSPGSSHFSKDREVTKQCAQRASFSVHGTGLRCCEGGWWCFCCADGAVVVEKDRAEQRRAPQDARVQGRSLPVGAVPEFPCHSHSVCGLLGSRVSTDTWNSPENASSGRTSSCVNVGAYSCTFPRCVQ